MSEGIEYVDYKDEDMLPDIQRLVSQDLSEPYSIYTYRFFLHNWPSLCTCVYGTDPDSGGRVMIATIVSKAEVEGDVLQGYIAMLAVDSRFRGRGIGSRLARINIGRMAEMGCKEIVLEAEASNTTALTLYQRMGFFKDNYMTKYYLNGGAAFRLKLWIDCMPGKENQPGEVEQGTPSTQSSLADA